MRLRKTTLDAIDFPHEVMECPHSSGLPTGIVLYHFRTHRKEADGSNEGAHNRADNRDL